MVLIAKQVAVMLIVAASAAWEEPAARYEKLAAPPPERRDTGFDASRYLGERLAAWKNEDREPEASPEAPPEPFPVGGLVVYLIVAAYVLVCYVFPRVRNWSSRIAVSVLVCAVGVLASLIWWSLVSEHRNPRGPRYRTEIMMREPTIWPDTARQEGCLPGCRGDKV